MSTGRILVLSSLLLSPLLVRSPSALGRDDLSATKVSRFVREYVEEKTEENRREELQGLLAGVDATLLARPLKRHLKKEKERGHAIGLAVTLKIPGLLESVKPLVETEEKDQVVEFLFATQELGAMAFVVEWWIKMEEDDPLFGRIMEGLWKAELDREVLDRLCGLLTGAGEGRKLRDEACSILREQFGLSPMSADHVLTWWREEGDEWYEQVRPFTLEGMDLQKVSTIKHIAGAKRYRKNLRVGPNGRVRFEGLPGWVQTNDFAIRVRVRVNEGAGKMMVGVSLDKGAWSAERADGLWRVEDGDGKTYGTLPERPGRWVIFEFRGRIQRDRDRTSDRVLDVLLDSKFLLHSKGKTADFDGRIKGILFWSDGGDFTVGGMELLRAPKKGWK